MFNSESYYELAHSGEKVPEVKNQEMLCYVKSFVHVIIWGGSFLGKAVGEYLLKKGVHLENYWDLRAEELHEVNGVKVILPFATEATEDTLVIFCIGNNIIRGKLLQKLQKNGYANVLRGDYLYEGTICPFDTKTEIDSKWCQESMCCRAMFCEKIGSIVKSRNPVENPLYLNHITLTINSRCSLKCKFCTSYMNEYPLEKRTNISTERICDDIDKFCDAMDSIGSITIMGGEPFMHPDLSIIVKKLLTKKNYGLISIATSATYPIKPEQLEGMEDKRVTINISNYEHSINENQRKMMHKNIDLLESAGLSYTVGITMPEWSVPSTLYSLNESEEKMAAKKKSCLMPPRCMMIKDGKLFPCDFGAALYGLGIADYKMDYIDIEHSQSSEKLKEQIRAYIEQPYYMCCGHCNYGNGLTAQAAEQGYMDFKKPI